MRSLVISIFLYARESWTLTAELQRRIQAMEMRCYRKILHISYEDHDFNEEVCAKIQQVIGPHEDLLTIVKIRKQQWYGHVYQVWPKPSCKAHWKGEEDKADKGRGWKTTSGNGQAWSLQSPRGQWGTEKWRKPVVKSCLVPQRPLQLRNRWRWKSYNYSQFLQVSSQVLSGFEVSVTESLYLTKKHALDWYPCLRYVIICTFWLFRATRCQVMI